MEQIQKTLNKQVSRLCGFTVQCGEAVWVGSVWVGCVVALCCRSLWVCCVGLQCRGAVCHEVIHQHCRDFITPKMLLGLYSPCIYYILTPSTVYHYFISLFSKKWLLLQVRAIWKLPEEQRKKVIKRLMLKFHPDKNPDKIDLCTKITQVLYYLQSPLIVLRLFMLWSLCLKVAGISLRKDHTALIHSTSYYVFIFT